MDRGRYQPRSDSTSAILGMHSDAEPPDMPESLAFVGQDVAPTDNPLFDRSNIVDGDPLPRPQTRCFGE